MTHKRTRHSAEFKAKVALEAAKDITTLNELAAKYGVHPAQISQWKKQLLDGLSSIFSTQKKKTDDIQQLDNLYRQIGEVTVQRDWLKKKLTSLH
jgi:transposase-like protein